MKIDVEIDLDQLRSKLLQVGHPVGSMPQWNGDKVWLVIVYGEDVQPWASVVKAKTKERAEEIGVANCKTRNGPKWEAVAIEVEFGSKQLLATTRIEG